MPRQGKQLNIWIPDDVMASLEHWGNENQTTKTVALWAAKGVGGSLLKA